ncbi:DnaJ domain protein [Metarhizium album ARSEF 1941]|uniref:DnaJ domain protein n=1 Tax=Metarhizium album (strain ARSEF 1941) TaxID=1081103 RepID=A0A0B2WXG3_METAS|nr:DnaJ domain protein [Metarhizium album ARSEF 1941]KHN98117.1 DnaJ domain protein [Metarhizium album ARSEF 1941]
MAPQKDYYADLGMPRDADIETIKKQYRKLALKYHPDRNSGNEDEAIAKFQIIQEAHEVLSDPASKANYDATLGKSRYTGASGVRGNPWADVGQQFPTPPRRTTAARNATSGAQRWQSRFSSGVPPTAKQTFGSDPNAKKNAAKAFENMRKNARAEPRSSEPPPPPPRQPPRTESARQRQEASFGSRKAGYYPRSTVPGDEPPVSNANYTNSERRNVPQPPPRKPVPNPMPDPLSQFREKATSSTIRHDDEQRSSGIPRRPNQEKPDASPPAPADGDQHVQNAAEGTGTYTDTSFKSRTDATFDSSGPNQAANSFTEKDSTSNKDEPLLYETPRSRHRRNVSVFSTYSASTKPGIAWTSPTAGLDSSGTVHENRSPSGNKGDSVALLSFERQQTNILNKLINNKEGSPRPLEEENRILAMKNSKEMTRHAQAANQAQSHSFSFPTNSANFAETPHTTGGRGFSKSSLDDIDTSFVKDDNLNNYQFNAGTAEGDANVKNGFNPNGWSDKFNAQTFVPQPQPGPSASPTRASRTNSRKTKIRPTVGTAATVEEGSSDEETYEWRGRNAQTQGQAAPATDSPQAMDIDSPTSSGATATQTARNIPVEPSRPEWRAGKVDDGAANHEQPQRPAKVSLDANAAGSEDSEEFRASFADFKNVPPFSQSKEGLESLNGMKDSLPFESKASDVPPVKVPKSVSLVFPSAPLAPRLPPIIAIEGMKPNAASWIKYVADFESYLREWDRFNGLVVDHFATRKSHIDNTRASKGYGFLAARGDGDLQEYHSWVQQDNDVRRQWNNACEEHESRMREFMAFRQRMKDSRV